MRMGVTQQELADATGLSLATVYRLESGQVRNPKVRDLANCALALGLELDDVIEDEWREWTNLDGKHPAPPDAARFLRPGRFGEVDP